MDIDIDALKSLRKKTGAGMLDCRKALVEAGGEGQAAEALLKDWGLAGVEKRLDRSMAEGRVFVHASSSRAAIVEISCETDFVARSEAFVVSGERIAVLAFERRLDVPDAEIDGQVAELARLFKENIALRRLAYREGGAAERLSSYVHGEGQIGVFLLAAADSPAAFDDERVASFIHDLALHIAAFNPLFLSAEKTPEAYLREKEEAFRQQVGEDEQMRGKSERIRETAVAGKMRKHLAEVCLLDRGFIKDEAVPVAEAMSKLAREIGFNLSVRSFDYFKIGE
jgi:elongation factor Ts